MSRGVGTTTAKPVGSTYNQSDIFIHSDDRLCLQLRTVDGGMRIVTLAGDPDMLLDMATQLLHAVQTIIERRSKA